MIRSARLIGRGFVQVVSGYRVLLGLLVVGRVATWLAHWALGPDPTRADIDQLGFGLPPLLDGRPWTLFTGMVLTEALQPPVPLFSLIGIALYEHAGKHWRTVVVLVGGQVLGVLAICALLYPVRNVDQAWIHGLAHKVDFGISVGGFATLGAWTAYLPVRWRRRLRLGLSCYFPAPLLISGLIYDLTHPAGWVVGLWLGARLRLGGDPRPALRRDEYGGLAIAAALGATVGIVVGHL